MQQACLELPPVPLEVIDALDALARKLPHVKVWYAELLSYYDLLDNVCKVKIPLK